MRKPLAFGLVLAVAVLFAAAVPARSQLQSVYASGNLSSMGASVQVDVGGQSTCRIALTNPISWGGNINAAIRSVGDTTFSNVIAVNDSAQTYTPTNTLNAPGYYTVTPQSAGTVEVYVSAYANGSISASINCSPASPAFQAVIPAITPWPVTTAAPVTQVTAVPSCPAAGYPCGLPTPIPTKAPQTAPTATAGVALPANEAENWSLGLCQYNGSNSSPAPATPNPTQGNSIACQANFDGSQLVSAPQINSQVTVSANGSYLATDLDGESSCNLVMTPSGVSANVNVKNSAGVVFAGPYTVSGGTNTATFQLVTDAYAVMDSLTVNVNSFSGSGTIILHLTCANTTGVEHVYQASAPWSVTFPSAQPVTVSAATPLPVTTPAPMPTAPSPAPAGVYAVGYNAAGPAAPVVCTHMAGAVITTSAATIVSLSAGKQVYVCAIGLTIFGSVAGHAQFEYGTGTNCATGTTALGPGYDFVASATVPTVVTLGTGVGQVLATVPSGNALCIVGTGTITAGHVQVMYESF